MMSGGFFNFYLYFPQKFENPEYQFLFVVKTVTACHKIRGTSTLRCKRNEEHWLPASNNLIIFEEKSTARYKQFEEHTLPTYEQERKVVHNSSNGKSN